MIAESFDDLSKTFLWTIDDRWIEEDTHYIKLALGNDARDTLINQQKTQIDTLFPDWYVKSIQLGLGEENWKELEKQDLNQTINTLAMASPFSLEEKQALLETQSLISRKFKLEEIIKTYILDDFSNTTIQ